MLTTVDITIIEYMARTLHVSAYADAHENGELPPDSPGAGSGEDWMDVTPLTSDEARITAAHLAGQIAALNGKSLLFLIRDAAKADGIDPDKCYGMPDPARPRYTYSEEFGHCLAMQSLGHGVSWFDDHEHFDIKLPHIEFHPEFSIT